MRIVILTLMILLSACNSTPIQQESIETNNTQTEIPISKKIYFLQHKILPEWTFTTDGQFYNDLRKGDLSKLKMAASDVISEEYANGISSKVINSNDAVLIIFPTPKAFVNCFYVLIEKSQDGFNYYTYEKSMSFSDNDPVTGVVGRWSVEGSHGNLGGRTYLSSDDFVADILNKND